MCFIVESYLIPLLVGGGRYPGELVEVRESWTGHHGHKKRKGYINKEMHNFDSLHTGIYMILPAPLCTLYSGVFVSGKCHASLLHRWQGDEFAVRQVCRVDY